MTISNQTVEERFKTLESKKIQVEARAEKGAELSIPALFPPKGHNESNELHIPNQSLGAKACNHLASKMMLALFPPNTAFFRLDAGIEAEDSEGEEMVSQVNTALAEIEKQVVAHLEATNLRSSMPNAILLAIVTGNVLLDVTDKGSLRSFSLRNYVVERDSLGHVIWAGLREVVSPRKLPQEVIATHFSDSEQQELYDNPDKEVEVYTVQQMSKDGKTYEVFQEIKGKTVAGSEGTYPVDSPRFIAIRWRSVDGEDYGRGLMEEYMGDFVSYDSLSRDIALVSKQNAKVLQTVLPNSMLKATQLTSAKSGTVLTGDADDVKTIHLDKNVDLQIPMQRADELKRSLSEAFLLTSSVQRNAERVTAEEIRIMAQELEDALGGVYSVFGQEVQQPLLSRLLKLLSKNTEIPAIPKGVDAKIITGLDALGRSHETNKLITLIRTAREVLGESVTSRLKADEVLKALGQGLGVDADKILKSQDEMNAEQQQQVGMDVLQNAAPGAIQQMMAQGTQPQ